MDSTTGDTVSSETYLGRKTLIMGDVNTGKTRHTLAIVQNLCKAGHGRDMVLLDLAPETTSGIGGKMKPPDSDILLLTCPIRPPRLTGRDGPHMLQLAQKNAETIEPLLDRALSTGRSILVVNDASLYLQAGRLERFFSLLAAFPTAIINAHYGRSFVPAPFTKAEREGVEALEQVCEQVIRLLKLV